jgi:hypothetical protein
VLFEGVVDMAKPKLQSDRLGKLMSVRLSENDHSLFDEKVRASGLSRSEYFRTCILGNRTTIIAKPRYSQDFHALLFILNRLDQKLGLIARNAVQEWLNGDVGSETYDRLLHELQSVNSTLSEELRDAHSD